MALKNFPYKNIDVILKKYIDDYECSYTEYLFHKIKNAIKRGYLTKDEFILICNWKSARSFQKIKINSDSEIKLVTQLAINSKDEKIIITELKTLYGVSTAMASAILMFINPNKYPVIDIRVWQVLYELKLVNGNDSGKSLTTNDWLIFLEIIRKKAKEYNITARKVEKAIFLSHKIYQDGNLY